MTLREQLEPLIRDWADQVHQDAGTAMFDLTQERCPVNKAEKPTHEPGRLKESGTGTVAGPLIFTIIYDAEPDSGGESYASYTDEGTEAHPITGNPLLAFFWEKIGADVVFRSVQWEPGPGVAANIGWFSDVMTEDQWADALNESASKFTTL